VGKDYRIGLVIGSVLAGVALLWVATRPSLILPPLPAPAAQGESPTAEPGPSGPQVRDPTAGSSRRAQSQEPPWVSGLQSALVRPAPPTGPDPAIRAADEPVGTNRYHTVRAGETLSSIAQQYYSTATAWRKILDANKSLKDPNKIAPGTELIIPE